MEACGGVVVRCGGGVVVCGGVFVCVGGRQRNGNKMPAHYYVTSILQKTKTSP